MTSKPAPSFSLTADGGPEQVLVYLLASEADVRTFTGDQRPNLMAACHDVTSWTHPQVVAVVYLPLDVMGAGLVTHELGHATFRVLNKRGRTLVANEEMFCTVLGELVREFYNRYYERQAEWITVARSLIAAEAARA